MIIRDRIKEFRRIPAKEISANEKNWRRHPQWQKEGMQAILENVGYAGALIAYESDGQLVLIDGHLRQEMTPDEEVPVLILDVNDEEADILLASYDPITAMASEDGQALKDLLSTIETSNESMGTLLQDITERYAASAIMEVDNETEAYYLPNASITGQETLEDISTLPTDGDGITYKALLVHFPQAEHSALMEDIFALGFRWDMGTVAEVLKKAIAECIAIGGKEEK